MTSLSAVVRELRGARQLLHERALLDDKDIARVEQAMTTAARGGRAEITGEMCAQHLAGGGKRVRARLALSAAECLGVSRSDAVPWAAAVEMLHNATLVHDDIQDGDVVRRGRPTVWAEHGVPQAINAGDLMLMAPVGRLVAAVDVDDATKWQLARALARRAEEVVRGQAADLALRAQLRDGEPVRAYMRAIAGKTGALFALPVEGAALMARRDVTAAARLAEPFAILGMLFQLQDDVLDLYGDKGRGEAGADIREGKISILVVEHLRRHPGDGRWLLSILDASRDETRADDVRAVIDRFREGGALAAALGHISAMASSALASPALDAELALRALVIAVAEQVLAPITHVMAGDA